MREVVFLKKNEKKWRETESILTNPKGEEPDRLAELFIELTDDLSYAQTHYPSSKTTIYLNGLTAEIYQVLYNNKKDRINRMWKFWVDELPMIFYSARRYFLYSFLFFMVSVLIGVVSTSYDETFPRAILGDAYVDMTINNIEKGDPLGVYKDDDQFGMFLRITFNNIRVAFYAYVAGITAGIGTVWLLFKNGIMLGSFQTMFYQYGLLGDSFLVVYIHGAIELSSIVIAGACGLMLGSSFIFPGTQKRTTALIKGAKSSLKIAVGLVPLFVLAGFLESFVTRYTDMPTLLKLLIILVSFGGIIFYFLVYPVMLHKRKMR